MNKYEVLGIVNEGAYGIVYKAKNKENGEIGKTIYFLTQIFNLMINDHDNSKLWLHELIRSSKINFDNSSIYG